MPRKKSKKDPVPAVIQGVGSIIILFGLAAWTLGGPAARAILGTLLLPALAVAGLGLAGLVTFIAIKARKARTGGAITTRLNTDPASVIEQQIPSDYLAKQLRTIDWFQFEKVMEILYLKQGYTVSRAGGANPDGGIDLVLERDRERVAVQCKHWKSWKVAVPKVRELVGAMTIAGISRGILVTISGYTSEAKTLAESTNISLIDETGVLQMLESADAQTDAALRLCFSDARKYCPKCENPMILRTAAKGKNVGSQFWGCSKYPLCRYILQVA